MVSNIVPSVGRNWRLIKLSEEDIVDSLNMEVLQNLLAKKMMETLEEAMPSIKGMYAMKLPLLFPVESLALKFVPIPAVPEKKTLSDKISYFPGHRGKLDLQDVKESIKEFIERYTNNAVLGGKKDILQIASEAFGERLI